MEKYFRLVGSFLPVYFSYYFILFSLLGLNFISYLLFYVIFYSVVIGFSCSLNFFETIGYSSFDLFCIGNVFMEDQQSSFVYSPIGFGPYTLFLFRFLLLVSFLILLRKSTVFLWFLSKKIEIPAFFWLRLFLNWSFSIQLRRVYFSSFSYFLFYPFFDLIFLAGFGRFTFFFLIICLEILIDRFNPSFASIFEVNAMNDWWTNYHFKWRKYGLWQVNEHLSDLDPVKRMGVQSKPSKIGYDYAAWTPVRGKWMPPPGLRPTFFGPGLDWVFKNQWKEVPPWFESINGNAYRAADFLEIYHHAFKRNYPWRQEELDWGHHPWKHGSGPIIIGDYDDIIRFPYTHSPCPIYPDPVEFPWAYSRKHCLWNSVLVSYGPAVNTAAGYHGPDGSIVGKAEAVNMDAYKLSWALSDPEEYHWYHEMPDTYSFVREIKAVIDYAVMSLTERYNYAKKHFGAGVFGSYVLKNIYWTPFAARVVLGAVDVATLAAVSALDAHWGTDIFNKTSTTFTLTGMDFNTFFSSAVTIASYAGAILYFSGIPWKHFADVYGLWEMPKVWDPKFIDEWGKVHNKRVMKVDWWHRLYRWEDPNDHDFDPFSSRTQEQRWRDIPFWYHTHPHLYKPFIHGTGNVYSLHRSKVIDGVLHHNLPNWWFTSCEEIDDFDGYDPVASRRIFGFDEIPRYTARQLHAETLHRLELREKYGRFFAPLKDSCWKFEIWGPRTHFGVDVYECPRFQEDEGDRGFSPMLHGWV